MYRTVHNIFALRSALNKFPLLPRNRKQVDGFAYERSAIEQWLKTHNTSPHRVRNQVSNDPETTPREWFRRS